MILTSNMIAKMRRYRKIDKNLEALLLLRYGTEPSPHTYSEQDLHEQIRKLIAQYNGDSAVASTHNSAPDVTRHFDSTAKQGGNSPENLT